MRKSFRAILKEQEIDELDKPLFGDKGGAKSDSEETPFGSEENDTEITEPEQTKEDPTFTFEIKGNFDFHELEKVVEANDVGLEAQKFTITVNTKGEVSDSDHEKFVKYIEDKMNFFKFEE
jgi:hypothetical protein